MDVISNLPRVITAIGGLGVAAFGFVDATKAVFGGVNHIGFPGIRKKMQQMLPTGNASSSVLPYALETLRQNWYSGTDLTSQKAIAKSMVKLCLNPNTAGSLATATTVDAPTLKAIATSISTGTSLTTPQSDTYARFDLTLTAILDATYQHADQQYKNSTRGLAMVVAILLAIAGTCVINDVGLFGLTPDAFWQAVIIGLLATPLAPISKDLATALATTVDALQAVKQ